MPSEISGTFSDLENVLLDDAAILARVAEMAGEIERDFAGRTFTVIVIMDGALFFVADLLRGIQAPLEMVSMNASSYHGGTKTTGEVRLPWPPGLEVRGRHVLVVDDILDTGLTLGVIQDCLALEGAASVRTAVLLKKKRSRERNAVADYVGFEIEDEFVVGYGMDYKGLFRNLPCIGTLKL